MVNVVPDRVELELLIRAKTRRQSVPCHENRTLPQAAALAFGGAVKSKPCPATNLLNVVRSLSAARANLKILDPEATFSLVLIAPPHDMGDVSMIIPSLHAYNGGFTGTPHGADFLVADPDKAYVQPAALLALNTVDLLFGDAAVGKRIAAMPTTLSREEYRALMQETSKPAEWDYRK